MCVCVCLPACLPVCWVWAGADFQLMAAVLPFNRLHPCHPNCPSTATLITELAHQTYGLMYNVGANPDPDLAPTIPVSLYFLFQLVFAICTPALIIGSVADRWVGRWGFWLGQTISDGSSEWLMTQD